MKHFSPTILKRLGSVFIILTPFILNPYFIFAQISQKINPHVTELSKEEDNKTIDINLDGILDSNRSEISIDVIREILAPLDTGDVIHTIPTPGPSGQGLTWDGNYLWVSDIDTDKIYKLSPEDGTILNSFSSPGDCVAGLAWDGTFLWASDHGGSGGSHDEIFQLDPSNGSVLHSFVPVSLDWPHGITWDGQYLWVNNFETHLLDKVDPFTGQILASIPAPGNKSIGLTWDGKYLWSDNFATDLLVQIDPSDGTIIRTVPSPHTNPRDLAWDGKYLWVVSFNTNTIYQVDVGYTNLFEEDLGVSQIQIPNIIQTGSLNTIEIVITNHGAQVINNTPVGYQIDNENPVQEIYTGTINSGASVTHVFSTPWIASEAGDYTIKAYVAYADDENIINNTLTKIVRVAQQNDVGISEIQVPSSVGVNRTVTIKVELTNYGIADQSNFPVSYQIGSGNWTTENFFGTLDSQEKAVYNFSETWTPSSLGSYLISARTGLNGDQNASNDNKQKNVTVFAAAYTGTWEGTTSQNNRPFYFHVNGEDEIDTLSAEIRVDFGSFNETRIWRNRGVVPIENDTFCVELSSPMIFIVSGKWPVVHGTFTDATSCDGTISTFVVTRGNLLMSTPVTNSSKTWTAERTSGTRIADMKVEMMPNQYQLSQNYPNPFNPSTTIRFQIPMSTFITLKVYDLTGKEIETLVSEYRTSGVHEITWNTNDLPSGIYLYRLETGEFTETKKMILQR